jgi:hypothetical protein
MPWWSILYHLEIAKFFRSTEEIHCLWRNVYYWIVMSNHNLESKCSKTTIWEELRSDRRCEFFVSHGGWSWRGINADLNLGFGNFLFQAEAWVGWHPWTKFTASLNYFCLPFIFL